MIHDAPTDEWMPDAETVEKVAFKHEGLDDNGRAIGPVYLVLEDGEVYNFRNGEPAWDDSHHAAWFALPTAREIAARFEARLEEG